MNNHGASINAGRRCAGFVLPVAFTLLLITGAACGVFLYAAYHHAREARRWQESEQCLLDAQSALEQVKHELVQNYMENQAQAPGALDWFTQWDINWIGSNPVYNIPTLAPINGSAVMVRIARVEILTNAGHAMVSLVGAAAKTEPFAVRRMITETLRVAAASGGEAQPFDYALLLNNNGRLRNNMVINGDVRINGNYRLNPSSPINGDRYASGQFTANSPLWSTAHYWTPANTSPRARPTNPTGLNDIAWPMGYLPDKSKNTQLPVYTMPAIGDIDALAGSANGRITRNGVEITVNTYAGAGPDGMPGTADDGCLVLDGATAPLRIEGTVVVKGDVIIRGQITGQGTIYAGRNVHITGNLQYLDPPAWPKPDENPRQTAALNTQKDLLVLAARGNVVVGNYTTAAWSNQVWSIMTDPANITPRAVSVSDAALGYDSDTNPSNGYLFDGRYFVNEPNNGQRLSGSGTTTVPRKFFESSLANATLSGLCDADVPVIDAALFSNHGIIGNLGSRAPNGNTVLNGAMACHNDLTAFYGLFTINWDIRLGSRSQERVNTGFMSVGGAGTADSPATISWREIH